MRIAIGVLALVGLAGCYLEGRAAGVATLRRDRGDGAPVQGGVDVGLYAADHRQVGAMLLGIDASPVSAADAPRVAMFSLGARYERAVSARRPALRGFGRVLWGFNLCPDPPSEDPDPSCDTPGEARSIVATSVALGVALGGTHALDDGRPELFPAVYGVGLAVVYLHASDAALGGADFLGLELSGAIGSDWFSRIHDDAED